MLVAVIPHIDRTPMPASSSASSQPSSLDSINERDLDLVLMIALHSSSAFRAALVKRLADVPIAGFISARRGVYDQQGETDILLEIRTESGERLAILIEDKIDASFQPRQAQRCRVRGEMGQTRDNWDRFLTCLCAPKRYALPHVGDWDRVLLLEDVADMLATHDEPFAAFLSSALRQAVDKHERGGFVPNLQATAFWKRYADLYQLEFRDLRMSALPVVCSANDPWPRFLATICRLTSSWSTRLGTAMSTSLSRDGALGSLLRDLARFCRKTWSFARFGHPPPSGRSSRDWAQLSRSTLKSGRCAPVSKRLDGLLPFGRVSVSEWDTTFNPKALQSRRRHKSKLPSNWLLPRRLIPI